MFGIGFAELIIIIIIAILFLGPDKLPSAMVDVAKFFRNVKKTVNSVKDSLEQEMNVTEIKQEALAYKKELLSASEELSRTTDMTKLGEEMNNLTKGIMDETPKSQTPKSAPEPEKVTFEKKSTIKEDKADV